MLRRGSAPEASGGQKVKEESEMRYQDRRVPMPVVGSQVGRPCVRRAMRHPKACLLRDLLNTKVFNSFTH
jgi:hypothetical protein